MSQGLLSHRDQTNRLLRELAILAELGIVLIKEGSQRVYYQVNSSSPLFGALLKICKAISEDME